MLTDQQRDALLADLADALAGGITPGEEVSAAALRDWSPETAGRPLAHVRPRTTEEVSAILRICNAAGCPVVPQGGMTGLAGGATASDGAVLLSLARLSGVEKLDTDGALMVVGAGTTLDAVQTAAAEAGLFFALDLGARGSCQIGGNISTNAGGNRVLKYGMMRDLVLGLEVVLADGTVLTMMNECPKNNAGPDLKPLFIGSEGTLGVITRAVLKLHPGVARADVALLAVPSFEAALAILRLGQAQSAGAISAFEAMWPEFLRGLAPHMSRPLPLPEDAPLYILIEMQGGALASDDALAEILAAAMEDGLILDAVLATTQRDADDLWRLRDMIAELQRDIEPVVNFDVSVPVARIGEAAERIRSGLAKGFPDKEAIFFGHVGDGNLHVVAGPVTPGGSDEREIERCVYEIVRTLSGSISAEHGIGMHKLRWLPYSRTPQELALLRQLKRSMDPKGILNPGKVIEIAGAD
ncbi:FAD-binding oxidoreductase [Salipiger sp. P9]|uniref:FAD-binding oxidoreductase n=1 Tax=Salipiger pentaromativorans TaxID=2943193 RepID=UPI002158607C|nr:FAD-binding oxidoreductase [Salipiger pentaromativorans]MCR8551038.1 FAD-binding oxidoreductase [Salipiger pentaromativorans]